MVIDVGSRVATEDHREDRGLPRSASLNVLLARGVCPPFVWSSGGLDVAFAAEAPPAPFASRPPRDFLRIAVPPRRSAKGLRVCRVPLKRKRVTKG